MARIARNELSIVRLADDLWQLRGYIHGRRIRVQDRDPRALDAKRDALRVSVQAREHTVVPRHTWLTIAQLRDAEAAVQRAAGVGLLECVIASERVRVVGQPKPCPDAAEEWHKASLARHRFPRTLEKNRLRLAAFFKAAQPATLRDITPEMIERHILNPAWAPSTQVTTGAVLRAWLNFCVKRRWLRESPFQLDLADLGSRTAAVGTARILPPAACHALLRAAVELFDGQLVPYTVLSLWCFLRSAEVQRTSAADLRLDAREPFVEIRPRKRGTVSYRTVELPACVVPVLRAHPLPPGEPVFFSRVKWDAVRERAGLLVRQPGNGIRGRRPLADSVWQPNILRHTGMSYLYQKTGNIREVCRQAGNSDDTAFRHYLRLPAEGDDKKFYAVIPDDLWGLP
jgi:hypothetical protein